MITVPGHPFISTKLDFSSSKVARWDSAVLHRQLLAAIGSLQLHHIFELYIKGIHTQSQHSFNGQVQRLT
jgi:hypothetical protein